MMDELNTYGGPNTVAIEQARELARRHHQVTIAGGWAGDSDPPTQLHGIQCDMFRLHRVSPSRRVATKISPLLFQWLARRARYFDLAHVHLSRDIGHLLATRLVQSLNLPTVVQPHGMITNDPRAVVKLIDVLILKRILGSARETLVLNESERRHLQTVKPVDCAIIPNGVSTQRIEVSNHRTEGGRAPDVLFLARLHERKGVLIFAEAARILIESGLDARFSVVGPDWGQLDELREFIARHSLSSHLVYEGALSGQDARRRMAQSDVYVLPARNEPFGMTVIEALSLGVPTICSDQLGISDDLAQSKSALVISPSPRNLATAIANLLASPALREDLRTAGHRFVENRYSIKAVVDRLESLYFSAYEGAGKRP